MSFVALKGNRVKSKPLTTLVYKVGKHKRVGLEDLMPGASALVFLTIRSREVGPDGGGLREADSCPYRQLITLSQCSQESFYFCPKSFM